MTIYKFQLTKTIFDVITTHDKEFNTYNPSACRNFMAEFRQLFPAAYFGWSGKI